ncbi:MAG: 6-phosphogluconate dehydrogenase, partial [Calditrichaeota bacterium]
MKIGFIGLGIMGKPMAKNLLKAGHELVVANRSQAAVEELVSFGAEAAKTPAEVASKVKVMITMLPNSPEVKEVVLGKNGIIEGATVG